MADFTHLRQMRTQLAPHAPQPAPRPAPPRGLPPAPQHAASPRFAPAPSRPPTTPAQASLPITPAARAMIVSTPATAPVGANMPPREAVVVDAPAPGSDASRDAPPRVEQPAVMPLRQTQMLTPAAIAPSPPPPTSVAQAMQTIARSAPAGRAAMQGRAGSVIHQPSNAPRYTAAPHADHARTDQHQQRHAAQGTHAMSGKTFSRTDRRIYLPLNTPGNVAAGAAAQITQRPQVNFQPDQLIVSPAIGAFFTIQSWSIGIAPQQAAGGGVKGDMFPAQNGPHFAWDVCDNGTDVIFNITNDDAAVHAFSAMLVGYQVEIGGS